MITIHRFSLPNGLRVVFNRDTQTSTITINTLFATGSRDETRSTAGIAHLFEHIMFGGSAHIHDFSAELQAAGGDDNAWTSQDFTNFYSVIPAHNIETALRAESDRLLAPALDTNTIKTQKKVVIEEFKQTLDRPYGDLYHHLLSNLYDKDFPYSHPVIGITPELIDGLNDEMVNRWFNSHYTPENAILSVVGNIEPTHLEDLVNKWYGDIPSRETAVRELSKNVFNPSRGHKSVTGQVPQTLVMIAFPMGGHGSREYYCGDILSDILSEGRAARFQQNILDIPGSVFTQADACISGFEHDGYFLLSAALADENPDIIRNAPEILIAEASKLMLPGNITSAETSRVLNRHESRRSLDLLGNTNRAFNIALAEYHGENINDEMAKLRAIGLEELAANANKIFSRKPAIITYTPAK